ncbi:uncharacterized protein LOC113503770 [Trichoplusia ni]|uniref:Uncharacterized protein LOC113503770 n=1 Tax=Trichoplusia ni TaxID=7111 RepID=A0A7E5WLM9_TRINI|nr:uncharacterized protein LOC113503770 [Trichoplusia ni]
MYSQIPFIETIPRQRSFGCLSLKFGSIFSALTIILYTILALAQCMATIDQLIPSEVSWSNRESVTMYLFAISIILSHCITLILTAIMLAGTLREKPNLMKPWVIWTSCLVMGNLLLMVYWTTITVVFNHIDDSSFLIYVVAFLILIIRFYMLMLVSSYYRQLIEESAERMKTLLNTDTWYSA